MESLDGATTRTQESEGSKGSTERIDLINTVLKVLGGFFLINGIYFALFTTGIYTAMVFYSFVLMVLTGIGYCYYFTADDVERLLYTGQSAGISLVDSFELSNSLELLDSFELPGTHSTPERRRRL
jgi:hypothetical protein